MIVDSENIDFGPLEAKIVWCISARIGDSTRADPLTPTSFFLQERFSNCISWHTSQMICAPFPIFNLYSLLSFWDAICHITVSFSVTLSYLSQNLSQTLKCRTVFQTSFEITQSQATALTRLRDDLSAAQWPLVTDSKSGTVGWKVIKHIAVSFKESPLASYISLHSLSLSLMHLLRWKQTENLQRPQWLNHRDLTNVDGKLG